MSFLLDPPFPPRLPLEAAASDSFEQQASAVAKLQMATEASFELEVSVHMMVHGTCNARQNYVHASTIVHGGVMVNARLAS